MFGKLAEVAALSTPSMTTLSTRYPLGTAHPTLWSAPLGRMVVGVMLAAVASSRPYTAVATVYCSFFSGWLPPAFSSATSMR